MKRIPKAKPVKIRITSGNEEHFSLESLQKNFVWDDIKKLLEGDRLDKWLRRINEGEKADRLKLLSNPEENIIEVYNILFRENNPFMSEAEVMDEFEKNEYLGDIVLNILSKIDCEELINCASKYKNRKHIFTDRILVIAHSFSNIDNPETLFKVGKYLYESGVHSQLGIDIIQKAKENGDKDALEFINKNSQDMSLSSLISPIKNSLRNSVLKDGNLKNQITNSWKNGRIIRMIDTINTGFGDYQKISNVCLEIYKLANSKTHGLDYCSYNQYNACNKLLWDINKNLDKISKNNIFYPDALFLKAIFAEDAKVAKEHLYQIKDFYGAARYLMDGKSTSLSIHLGLNDFIFRLMSNAKSSGNINVAINNTLNLDKFIFFIDNFRTYNESHK